MIKELIQNAHFTFASFCSGIDCCSGCRNPPSNQTEGVP
jgi:hypothetical protein